MKKDILFDLDGTLTDSGPGIIRCFQITLSHFGLPVPEAHALRVCVGPPLRDSFLHFGVLPKHLEEAVEVYRKHYLAEGQYENFPYPGIADTLRELKAQGHRLFIATSKPEAMAVDILTRFGLAPYFDIICGATPDGSRNTKSAVIAHLLGQLETAENLIMVGDTIFDVEGAKAHGIPTVAVTWGYGDAAQMQAAGARLADTMQDLLEIIG